MDFIFDPSLVLYLPLYELDGSSFMSKDAYGHLYTVTGALWRPSGRYFDGTDDLINCGTTFNALEDLTVEAWVQFVAVSNNTWVFNKYANTSDAWGLYVYNNAFKIYTDIDNEEKQLYNTSCVVGVWYHIVALMESKENKLYVNGVLKGSGTSSSDYWSSFGGSLYLGSRRSNAGFINMLCGEFRLYRRALTPLEIQHNYEATKWRYR